MANKYTYKGTKMTGTKTTASTRPGAGIKKAAKGDTYLNTSTGHVYKCTDGGNKDKAKWKYIKTVIIGRPNISVRSLKLKREAKGSHVMTATWGVPKELTESTNGKRAQALVVRWSFSMNASGKSASVVDKDVVQNEQRESLAENLASFDVENGSKKVTYTRRSFWPFTKTKLLSVGVSVRPKNSKGEGSKTKEGKPVIQSADPYVFKVPKQPAVTDWAFDDQTGIVSCKITTDPGNGTAERYDTEYKVTVTDKFARTVTTIAKGAKTDTSIPIRYDATNYQQLGNNQYIEVKVIARARGFAGDSAWTTSTYYVSFPKPVQILNDAKKQHVTVSSRDSGGKVTVPIKVNYSTQFPVDYVKLQMLVNVPYDSPDKIPGDADWREPGAIDNGNCAALIGSVGDMMPVAGNHSWVRVKAWHANEDALFSYSNIVEVPLFTPAATAADDKCAVLSTTPNADGTSVTVVVGYDSRSSSSDDDGTGTQVGWSEYEDAWQSTEQPDTFDIDWAGTATASGDDGYDDWKYTHTLVVRGLEEGASYYVRARRYLTDEEDKTTYGEWCSASVVQTASIPPSAVLQAPTVVRVGRGLPISWTLAARTAQTSWQAFGGDVILASGEDAAGACVIPAERVAAYTVDGAISVGVRCSTGGEWVESTVATVLVAEPPEAVVDAATVTAQPASIVVESASSDLTVAWAVTATSDAGTGPDGSIDQYSGDVATSGSNRLALADVTWANSILHARYAEQVTDATTALAAAQAALDELEPGDEGYDDAYEAVQAATAALATAQALESTPQVRRQATVALPARTLLHDESSYDVTITPTDPTTLLVGASDTCEMAIDYAHKAPTPSEDNDFEPFVTTDDKGFIVRGCTLTLVAPDGAADTDVHDVYRITHDGELLASPVGGLPLTYQVDDQWATFGDAGDYGYRVVCRTVDGSIAWSDYDYYADAGVLRIDWGGQSVELPYNLTESDKYAKDVEIRTHWDGTVSAYHNQGVKRTASLSTDVIRVEDAETAALLRSLARYPGTAYVRTPTGSAYEAVVQISGMNVEGSALGVSIDATEVAPSEDRQLPPAPQSTSDEIDYEDPEDPPEEPEEEPGV